MAYDPTNFFNNGTLVGVAGNVNAPGGQGTWVIVNGVASYYPPNSTAYIPGAGITITGTAPVLTIANAGVVDLIQGSITAAGVIDIGANLTLNAGGTLSGSAGGGGSLGVNYAGTIYPTVAAGAEISLSGAAGVLTIASEGITAEVGTIFSSFNTLVAGSEITFSGTSPDLTISSAGGAGGITEFVQGTITATGTATVGTGLTLTGTTNPTLTAGAAAGTIGVEFGGTLYPTLAAGSGFTLTGSGATLTGSASGGGGGSGALTLIAAQTISSGATEVDFLGVFTSTYDVYQVEILELVNSSGSVGVQWGNQSGPTWSTGSNYYAGQNLIGNTGSNYNFGVGPMTYMPIFQNTNVASNESCEASVKIQHPLSGAHNLSFSGIVYYAISGALVGGSAWGVYFSTTAFDSFRLIVTSGSFTGGIVRVYGYQT